MVCGAALGLATGLSVFLGAGAIFLKPIASAFGWGRADIALLPMMAVIGSAIGAPCMGHVADRMGWNRIIGFSIVMVAVGLLAMSLTPPSRAYVAVVGLLIGILGVATTPTGYVSVLSRAFDRRLGTALGLALVGVGAGLAAVPILASKLLETIGWRQAYASLAALTLVLGVVSHQLVFRVLDASPRNVSAREAHASGGIERAASAMNGIAFMQAIRGYRFWLIGGVGLLSLFSTLGATVHLASYATDRGFNPMAAGRLVGLVGLGLIAARVGAGLMLDRMFAPAVGSGMFLVGAAGFFLLTIDLREFAWTVYLGALFVGISHGAEGDLIPFLARRYFGVSAFGSIYGALLGMAIAGGAAGTYVYGWSVDVHGTYTPILQVAMLLCCTCSVAILALGRYQYAAERLGP